MQTIYIKNSQVFYTPVDGYEKESQLYALIDQASLASEIIGIKW